MFGMTEAKRLDAEYFNLRSILRKIIEGLIMRKLEINYCCYDRERLHNLIIQSIVDSFLDLSDEQNAEIFN
jgi:hypothetical protein